MAKRWWFLRQFHRHLFRKRWGHGTTPGHAATLLDLRSMAPPARGIRQRCSDRDRGIGSGGIGFQRGQLFRLGMFWTNGGGLWWTMIDNDRWIDSGIPRWGCYNRKLVSLMSTGDLGCWWKKGRKATTGDLYMAKCWHFVTLHGQPKKINSIQYTRMVHSYTIRWFHPLVAQLRLSIHRLTSHLLAPSVPFFCGSPRRWWSTPRSVAERCWADPHFLFVQSTEVPSSWRQILILVDPVVYG